MSRLEKLHNFVKTDNAEPAKCRQTLLVKSGACSSSPIWREAVTTASPDLPGYQVSYKRPLQGVELVRRYGEPAVRHHSIQLEINRKFYMNEKTLALAPGFEAFKGDLCSLLRLLLKTGPRKL